MRLWPYIKHCCLSGVVLIPIEHHLNLVARVVSNRTLLGFVIAISSLRVN